jgi:cell division septal protein FtsQ
MKRNVNYNRQLNLEDRQPDLPSEPIRKKRKTWKKLIRPTIVVLAICLLAYAVIASALFKIQTIQIDGAQTLSEDSIRQQTLDIITSSALTQNIIFAPTNKISDELKKQNYQIAEAEVTRSGLNSITVKITEQKPSILWLSGNTLSIIGANGHAYDGDITPIMKDKLVTVVDTTNLPVKKGEKVVTQEFVDFVNAIKEQLPNKGIEVNQYQIGDTTTELRAVTEGGYYIRFDITRPVEEQLQDLSAVLGQMKKQGKKAAEYIDLRINGKVFYK